MKIPANFKVERYIHVLIVILLIVFGTAVYINSFANKMFWDDDDFILKNQYIRDWRYFPKFFSENLIAGSSLVSNYWRPLLLTVFSLEWHLWKNWPPGFHLVNTSFHIADGILLYFFLLLLFKDRWLAFLTSLVFLVHPIQTEAVVYVNSLGDSFSAFFMFIGLILYIKFRLSPARSVFKIYYAFSIFMYILALMSKEISFVLPALIFISDFIFFGNTISLKEKIKKIFKSLWPFLVVAVIYIILRATILNFNNTFNFYKEQNAFSSNFTVRLLTFFHALTSYFGFLFWPVNLHVERSLPWATSLFSPLVLLGCVLFTGMLGIAVWRLRQSPIIAFGILWFLIGLFPTSNILIPINAVIYEHWLYVPMIGIFLILIWVGKEVARKYKLENIFNGTIVLVLIFLSVLAMKRNLDWRDPIIFYEQTLKYAPASYRVINNLGMMYNEAGFFEKAQENYLKAIALDPTNPVAYHNLANNYEVTGRYELASENFQKALQIDPKFLFSYGSLANLYLKFRKYPEARRVLEQYLDHTENKLNVLTILAQVAMDERNLDAALGYLEKAAKLAPDDRKIQAGLKKVKDLLRAQNIYSPLYNKKIPE